MSKETEELLKVLDMPEFEQGKWCRENIAGYKWRGLGGGVCGESLADLAFRLRDEAEQKNPIIFGVALVKVQQKAAPDFNENHHPALNTVEWFIRFAKPIHFIIAALIAKQKEKPDNGNKD